MRNTRRIAAVVLAALAGTSAPAAYATKRKAVVVGTVAVQDAPKRVLPNATVRLRQASGRELSQEAYTGETDQQGRFTIKDVPTDDAEPYCYDVNVEPPDPSDYDAKILPNRCVPRKGLELSLALEVHQLDAPKILRPEKRAFSLKPAVVLQMNPADIRHLQKVELFIASDQEFKSPAYSVEIQADRLFIDKKTGEFSHKVGDSPGARSGNVKLAAGARYWLRVKLLPMGNVRASSATTREFEIPASQNVNPPIPEKILTEDADINTTPAWVRVAGRQEVVYASNAGGGDYFQLWRRNPGSSGVTQVTTSIRDSSDLFPAAIPGRDSVLFVSNRTGGVPNLWSISLKGAPSMTQLTQFSEGGVSSPSVSRDGALVVFARTGMDAKGKLSTSIWTMTPAGEKLTQICAGTWPKLSPDGKQILYVNQAGARKTIWRIGADGTNNTQVTPGTSNESFPDWIDDNKIIFVSDRTENADLWMMDLRDRSLGQLTNNLADDYLPAVSPDGTLVAYVSDRGSGPSKDSLNIYWMNLEPVLQAGSPTVR